MSFSDRGKKAEAAAQKYLEAWQARSALRESNRLVDSKAAGRIIKAAAADFEYFQGTLYEGGPRHGLIEVKETEHEYRLDKSRITQLPRLRKREKCGGRSLVLVLHSTIKRWRVLDVPYMVEHCEGASWDMRDVLDYGSVEEALSTEMPDVFDSAQRA